MSETEYSGIVLHFNRIYDYDNQGAETEGVLLSHPIYFLQNGYDKIIDIDTKQIQTGYLNPILAAKAILLLHSMPFNYGNIKIQSFFNSENASNVGYEMVPYGMLVLMGGLLYRKMVYNETKNDIINTGNIYKKPDINQTFLVKGNNGVKFGVISKGSNKIYEPLSTVIKDNVDIYITNKLIELFKNFVETNSSVIDSMEIRQMEKIDTRTTYVGTRFTYKSFTKMVDNLCSKDYSEVTAFLSDSKNIGGFCENYMFAMMKNSKLWMYYREDCATIQRLFDNLYNHKCGVLTLVCQSNVNTKCVINTSVYKAILNGFSTTLQKLLENYENTEDEKNVIMPEESINTSDDDLKKSIYLYMKQFWDKWLCCIYNDKSKHYDAVDSKDIRPFTVEWFKQQFLFIDSFYNDISSTLKLNCEELLGFYEGSLTGDGEAGTHVLNHLANVAQKHHCNFFCYPDFINFAKSNGNDEKESPDNILRDLFKPVPYNKINPVEVANQFVIIRASNAQITGNKTEFKNDGFDIWTSDKENDVIPSTFKNQVTNYNSDNPDLRMAYKVPSFGVAFSRQNNSLFKSIDIGMDTQQITEQSIKTLCQISQLGNNNKRAVTFYGNDIYGIYSSYSYIVTITMMGDAQIQPLMYFQLMNIPMFRGTYMVIEVKHSIKQGDFTTTFRGMKMSKIEPPITSSWFTIEPETSDSKDSTTDNCGGNQVNSDGTPAPNGTGEILENKEARVGLFQVNFKPSQLRLATKYTDSANDNYFTYNQQNHIPPEPDTVEDVYMLVVGPSFYESDGSITGMVVVNGTKHGSISNKMGGFVLYDNNTYTFCLTHNEFEEAVNKENVKFAWQNFVTYQNSNQKNKPIQNDTKYIYQSFVELQNGTLAFITSDNKCTYAEFDEQIRKLNPKNAIYKDTNGSSCYGWSRTKNTKINGSSTKISNGVYKWGGNKNNKLIGTIFYIVKR